MQKIDTSLFKNKSCALVLSGGVVKAAAWHMGVALALEELGFTFDEGSTSGQSIGTLVGSSAGSLINLFLANGFTPEQVIKAFVNPKESAFPPVGYRDMLSRKFPKVDQINSQFYDPFDGLPSMLKRMLNPILKTPGFFTTAGLKEYIESQVIQDRACFKDYKTDLFVVATHLDQSKKVIFGKYNYPNARHDSTAVYQTNTHIADAVAASMSVPPFYAPYPIHNTETKKTDFFIDGEIRETLSTHVAIDNKCEYIISSWTHTPYHFNDEIGSLYNYGIPAISIQAIHLLIQKKIVAHRASRIKAADILDTVNDYFKSNRLDEIHRKNIMGILERKLDFQKNVKLIDIYPKHKHYRIFFTNSFSLNPQKLSKIVTSGYRRTLEVFNHHEWEA